MGIKRPKGIKPDQNFLIFFHIDMNGRTDIRRLYIHYCIQYVNVLVKYLLVYDIKMHCTLQYYNHHRLVLI